MFCRLSAFVQPREADEPLLWPAEVAAQAGHEAASFGVSEDPVVQPAVLTQSTQTATRKIASHEDGIFVTPR